MRKAFDDSIKTRYTRINALTLEDARKIVEKSCGSVPIKSQLKTAMLLSTLLICVCVQQGLVESNTTKHEADTMQDR